MDPRKKLENAAQQTGWNEASMLSIALEYIRNQNADDAFAGHVDMAVERETGGSLQAESPTDDQGDNGSSSSGSEEEMGRYVARVDMVIKAENEHRASDFVSELLNQGLGLVDEPKLYDWAYGSGGAEKFRSPVIEEENPYPHFTAGAKG